MLISKIMLKTLLKYSDKNQKVNSMSNSKKDTEMNKTEIYINLLHVISSAPGRKIGNAELKRLLGNPPKASYHRLVKELKEGSAFMPSLLSESKHKRLEDRIYKLNSKVWNHFVTAGSEGYFFLEAFKRLGKVINSDFTKLNFEDMVQVDGRKIVDLDRKFMYLSKIDAKVTPKLTHMVDHIVTALLEHKQIKMIYRPTGRQGDYERIIEPLTLCQYRDDLYVMCYKVEAGERMIRNYKISRIEELELLDEDFIYPSPAKWDPERDYAEASGLIKGEVKDAIINVYGPTRQIFEEKNFFNNFKIDEGEDYTRYQCKYSNLNEFVGQLFVYAEDVEVMAPLELKKEFSKKAHRALFRNQIFELQDEEDVA